MLKDEFNHLMALFREGAEGKKVNLHQLFSESLAFFEHLKEEFQQASPEERAEVLQMMTAMHREIIEESKKIMKTSGLTEEQLLSFAENPSNFTPEQWKEFQESKSQIHKAGMDLVKVVKKLLPPAEHKQHSVQEISPPGAKKHKKGGGKTGWMQT